MRISSRQTHQIQTGHKTQIRTLSTARYLPGKSYPVNDHKGQRRCRIIISAVDTQPLAEVDYTAARAEGHRTTDEFRAWWISEHDKAWLANHADADLEQQLARFHTRWAHKTCTVLTISLDTTERPRLLMPTGRRGGDELGYTENGAKALRDEPEAVDELTLARYVAENRSRDLSRITERNQAWELHQALQAAEAAGVDVTRERLAIQRRIMAMQRKAQQKAA